MQLECAGKIIGYSLAMARGASVPWSHMVSAVSYVEYYPTMT